MTARTSLPLLILGVCVCALGILIAMPNPVTAQPPASETPQASPTAESTPTAEPKTCAECHVDIVAQWNGSPHAGAYSEANFQSAWREHLAKNAADKTCLTCHTTQFVAFTGSFAQENVTCEACHGTTPFNHPPESVAINKDAATCGTCHTTTVAEWTQSAHGAENIACASCHIPHTQAIRFESVNALCINCHKDAQTSYTHVTHTEQSCADCHWHHGDTQSALDHPVSGKLAASGHDGKVEITACTDCHSKEAAAAIASTPQAEATQIVETVPTVAEKLRAEELETQLKTMQAEANNASLLRVAEGILIGAVLGGLLMTLVWRVGKPRQDAAQSGGNHES